MLLASYIFQSVKQKQQNSHMDNQIETLYIKIHYFAFKFQGRSYLSIKYQS